MYHSKKTENIIYGIHSLNEISKTTGFYPSDVIYTTQRSHHIRLKNIINKARRSGARIEITNIHKINQIAGQNKNQGILLERKENFECTEISIGEVIKQRSGIYVLIERLNDPQNLGSIVRSMAAFGCQALIINKSKTPPLGRVVWKVSTGALAHIPVLWINGCQNFITKFKQKTVNQNNFIFLGASLNGTPMNEEMRKKIVSGYPKIFLVLGDEEKGISTQLQKQLDLLVRVPHNDKVDSLNVGVAAGILLYLLKVGK